MPLNLLLLIVLTLAKSVSADVPAVERNALVALYNSTNGPEWGRNTKWLSTSPVSEWYGITVSGGRVIKVELENNNLSGVLPGDIVNLTYLKSLKLYYNYLTGPIPAGLWYLSNLEELVVHDNRLTGPLPPAIGYLTKLKVLDLSSNPITGSIPSEISNLVNLTELVLHDCQLTGSFPIEFCKLTNLTHLILYYNDFTGSIPPQIENLTKLTVFSIFSNKLTGSIPLEICNLINLEELVLYENNLTGSIPSEIGNLEKLKWLHLHSNGLTGSIPPGIGNLENMEWLTLYCNELSGSIPVEISNLTNLVTMRIQTNSLTGSIPPEIGNMSNLKYLSLNSNKLSGAIPPELGNLSNLEWLYLYDNQLTGTIPTELSKLNNLFDLNLSYNEFTGTIPVELCNLNLIYLALSSNHLTGSIPTEIGFLTNLSLLWLEDNELTGEIPVELYDLTRLNFLELTANDLSGTISSEIGNLTNLWSLDLSYNKFTGTIPSEIGNLHYLTSLSLSDNRFTGTIPFEIGNLHYLMSLNLSNNRFTGSFPDEIVNITDIRDVRIDSNSFIDFPDISTLTSLNILYLRSNKFTFEDIEPNIGVPSTFFSYAPQDSIGDCQEITINQGESLTVSVAVGGEHNMYQWFKDGSLISGAEYPTHVIDPVTNSDSGIYTCEITNTVATDLTLYRRPIIVEVQNAGEWIKSYKKGWSMVSLGLDFYNKSAPVVFPEVISVYEFNGSQYVGIYPEEPGILEFGKGYWVNLSDTVTVNLDGEKIENQTLDLSEKWSMIGSVSNPVNVSDIVQNPADNIISIYSYDGSQYTAIYPSGSGILEQGKGYWINMASSGTVNMSSFSGTGKVLAAKRDTRELFQDCIEIPLTISTSQAQKTLLLFITDQSIDVTALNRSFEMPPVPPFGSFDARIVYDKTNGLGNLVVTGDEDYEATIDIMVPNISAGTAVSWLNNDLEHNTFYLSDGSKTVDMAVTNHIEVNGNTKRLTVTYHSEKNQVTPTEYSLFNNYPNPFNPETTIPYTIKQSGMVELTVYNALGQEVTRLVQELREPGMHKAVWDGKGMYGGTVSGGLYLYRLRVNDFVETKKMLFMK